MLAGAHCRSPPGRAWHFSAARAAHCMSLSDGPADGMWTPLRQRTACSGHKRLPLGPHCMSSPVAAHFTAHCTLYYGGRLSVRPERQPHALSGGHMQCADRRRNAFRAGCSRRGERSRRTRSGPAAWNATLQRGGQTAAGRGRRRSRERGSQSPAQPPARAGAGAADRRRLSNAAPLLQQRAPERASSARGHPPAPDARGGCVKSAQVEVTHFF